MPPKAQANGVAAKAKAKVAVAGKAERERLRQMPLTARAEAAVAKARACATVAGMRALSLCSPLGDSESEPWLHPLSEETAPQEDASDGKGQGSRCQGKGLCGG